MKSVLNHIAILVGSIEETIEASSFPNEIIGPVETFPSEGTKEVYVGPENQLGRVLLMQPNGDGPYLNALKKRGPGLHHVAIDVENLDNFLNCLPGSGWFLHPKSISFYKDSRQVYLCRPGVSTLIEVQERKVLSENECFASLHLPFPKSKMHEALFCENIYINNKLSILGANGEKFCQFLI